MKTSMLSLCVLMMCFVVAVRECTADQNPSPSPAPAPSPSPECLRKDCPKYDVIYTQEEFEIRSYTQALWASSSTYNQTSVLGALGKGFKTLVGYFDGENDQMVSIQYQPLPVVLLEADNSNYTLYFYVPQNYQSGSLPLPKPNDPAIKAVQLPENKYAAVIRGTDLGEEAIKGKIDELKRSLQGTPYQRAAAPLQFSTVIYNAPQFFENTDFEILIWFD